MTKFKMYFYFPKALETLIGQLIEFVRYITTNSLFVFVLVYRFGVKRVVSFFFNNKLNY